MTNEDHLNLINEHLNRAYQDVEYFELRKAELEKHIKDRKNAYDALKNNIKEEMDETERLKAYIGASGIVQQHGIAQLANIISKQIQDNKNDDDGNNRECL